MELHTNNTGWFLRKQNDVSCLSCGIYMYIYIYIYLQCVCAWICICVGMGMYTHTEQII